MWTESARESVMGRFLSVNFVRSKIDLCELIGGVASDLVMLNML